MPSPSKRLITSPLIKLLPPPEIFIPSVPAPANVPSNSINGELQVAPGWLSPSIIVDSVSAGKAEVREIVFTPAPDILKVITVTSGLALAVVIATRREPDPLLLVFVTINGVGANAITGRQAENSEVSNGATARVAVAVTTCPTGTDVFTVVVKDASPPAFVVTLIEPR